MSKSGRFTFLEIEIENLAPPPPYRKKPNDPIDPDRIRAKSKPDSDSDFDSDFDLERGCKWL